MSARATLISAERAQQKLAVPSVSASPVKINFAPRQPRPPENGSNPPARGIEAGIDDANGNDFHEEIDRQKAFEWIHAELATMAALRAERLRELNEESGSEAKGSNAGRHSRRDWQKNGKPADRSKARDERDKTRTTGTNSARTVGDSAEPVNAGSGVTVVEERRTHSAMRERAR